MYVVDFVLVPFVVCYFLLFQLVAIAILFVCQHHVVAKYVEWRSLYYLIVYILFEKCNAWSLAVTKLCSIRQTLEYALGADKPTEKLRNLSMVSCASCSISWHVCSLPSGLFFTSLSAPLSNTSRMLAGCGVPRGA